MMDQHAVTIDDQRRESWKFTTYIVCCGIMLICALCSAIGLVIRELCQSPTFPDFSITSLHVSVAANDNNINNTNNTWIQSRAAAVDVQFSMVLNNRGDEIKYSDLRASVYYQGSLLASTSLYPFQQEAKNVMQKNVSMRAMINMDQVFGIRAKLANNTDDRVFTFDVSVVSSRTEIPTENDAEVCVLCNGVRVQFTNVTMAAGCMIGGPNNCNLQVHYLPPPDRLY